MIKDLCFMSYPQCTSYDLLERGMEVHIVADAVSARRYLCIQFFFLLYSSVITGPNGFSRFFSPFSAEIQYQNLWNSLDFFFSLNVMHNIGLR